jgi:uncharacterized protein (TIGR03437 family)
MTWLCLAVLAAAPSMLGCDPGKITLIGIAPVRVNIPVGGTANVGVFVECQTNSNDWDSAATISGGGTIKFDVRLVDEDQGINPDDILGASTFSRSVRGPLGRDFRGFTQSATVVGTVQLSCPASDRQVVGSPDKSGEGEPPGPNCSDPADLVLEVDNGSAASSSYSASGVNRYAENLFGNPGAQKTVPACCVEICLDEEASRDGVRGVQQSTTCQRRTPIPSGLGMALEGGGQALGTAPTASGTATPNLLCTGSPSSANCAMAGSTETNRDLDPRNHNCCTGMPPNLALRHGIALAATNNFVIAQTGRSITVTGAAPWVEVSGPLAVDGTFVAEGRGTVAGRPNVRVRFIGKLTPMGVTGDYSMGVGGELPGAAPVTYIITARRTAWDAYWKPIAQAFQRAAESLAEFNLANTPLGGVDFSTPMVRIATLLFEAQGGVYTEEGQFRPASLTAIREVLETLAGAVSRSTLGNRSDIEARLREAAGHFATAAATLQQILARSAGAGDEELLRLINSWEATVAQAGGALRSAGLLISGATVANVSAASFTGPAVAANSIAVGFGRGLATATQPATTTPLPTRLAGTTVRVKDSAGAERLAPLFYASPTQVNYLVPPGTRTGPATVTVNSSDNSISTGNLQVDAVAPSLFSANASGRGVAAALVLRAAGTGAQTVEQAARFDAGANTFVPAPIDLGPEADQVFLVLFGTGIRGFSSAGAVQVTAGGQSVPVPFAGAQGQFVGLDQLNVGPLPRGLAGRGEVNVVLTVDGKTANTVTVAIR